MNNNDIMAVIVCYNPDIDKLNKNVRAIYHQVSHIYIVDNGSLNLESYKQTLPKSNLDIIELSSNKGIAYALNVGYNACKDKCSWFITLDQDSCSAPNMVLELKKHITDKNIAIISPRIVDINYDCSGPNENVREITSAITSGCLNSVACFEQLGGFDEKMFIDYVDHEICLRFRLNGYKIIIEPKAVLYQEVGQISSHKFLGINMPTTNHRPFRRYFLFRNKVYMFKKYFRNFPGWCINDFFSSVKTFTKIVLLEKQRSKNVKCIFRGLLDGIIGRFDNQWPFNA